jgi:hypothetical protein
VAGGTFMSNWTFLVMGIATLLGSIVVWLLSPF